MKIGRFKPQTLTKIMNELAKLGKKRTILISLSVLLVSIHTIYFYHSVKPDIETDKLIQQLVRFSLTIALLILVYKGKKWAKIVSIVLFSFGLLAALLGLMKVSSPLIAKTPLLVMVFVYGLAVYHFGFAQSFKAIFAYQNRNIK